VLWISQSEYFAIRRSILEGWSSDHQCNLSVYAYRVSACDLRVSILRYCPSTGIRRKNQNDVTLNEAHVELALTLLGNPISHIKYVEYYSNKSPIPIREYTYVVSNDWLTDSRRTGIDYAGEVRIRTTRSATLITWDFNSLSCISSDQIWHSVVEKERVTGFDGGANQTAKTHKRYLLVSGSACNRQAS